MKTYTKIDNVSNGRFEYRVFGDDVKYFISLFKSQFYSVNNITPNKTVSEEIYLISKSNSNLNIKIRENTLDIKKLITKTNKLEQWEPIFKVDFPIEMKVLKNILLSYFDIETADLKKDSYTLEQFLSIINEYKFIDLVNLHKKKEKYTRNNIIFEFCDIKIENKPFQTICLESNNKSQLEKFLDAYPIDNMKNTNYIEAIKNIEDFNTSN